MASQKWSKDVVAVVTGGNKGIGYEIVKGLAKAGITVVLTARDEGRGTAAVKALQKEGLSTIHFYPLNVGDAKSVKELATWLGQQFGGIDILVNNAGIFIPDETLENAFKTFETNVWGVQRVTEGLLTLLQPTGLRRIVNVSSQLGRLQNVRSAELRARLNDVDSLTFDGVEALAQKYLQDVEAGTTEEWGQGPRMYSQSKAVLNAYTRVLARSLASKEVFVNATCPGFTSTDLNSNNPNARPVAEGADTIVWLCLLPEENYPFGKFFADRKQIEF